MRVVAVGECTIDRYLELGVEHVGGISLNFAVNAKRAGAEHVTLVSGAGTDLAAGAVQRKLRTAGIDAGHLHTLPGATASQVIQLAAGGERIFPPGGYDPGVLSDFRLDDTDLSLLRTADIVAIPVFRQLAHLSDPILRARDLGAMRVVDLLDGADLGDDLAGIDPLLDSCELLFISGDDTLVERLLPRSRTTRSVFVVTHGAAGSSALVRGERSSIPAESVPITARVDTTGCGDAFQAAFTVQYLRTRDIHEALDAGAKRAAQVIRHLGATADASVDASVDAGDGNAAGTHSTTRRP